MNLPNRELMSDVLIVCGAAALVAAGFVLHLALGLFVLAVALLVIGLSLSPPDAGGAK